MPGEYSSGVLNTKRQGIVGFKGLSLGTSPDTSIIGSDKGNVHLDIGTQMILRTQ